MVHEISINVANLWYGRPGDYSDDLCAYLADRLSNQYPDAKVTVAFSELLECIYSDTAAEESEVDHFISAVMEDFKTVLSGVYNRNVSEIVVGQAKMVWSVPDCRNIILERLKVPPDLHADHENSVAPAPSFPEVFKGLYNGSSAAKQLVQELQTYIDQREAWAAEKNRESAKRKSIIINNHYSGA